MVLLRRALTKASTSASGYTRLALLSHTCAVYANMWVSCRRTTLTTTTSPTPTHPLLLLRFPLPNVSVSRKPLPHQCLHDSDNFDHLYATPLPLPPTAVAVASVV